MCCDGHYSHILSVSRDYADFTIPPPFSSRVRNALNAEAKSVRLSALVGAGGLWYGFGKIIMRL
jgi:GINS complex subunit 3